MGALLKVQVLPLGTAREVKCDCMRVPERGKEGRSVRHEPMNKNRIEVGADQGLLAEDRETFVTKGQVAYIWRLCSEGVHSYLERSRRMSERTTAVLERPGRV